MSSIPTLPSDTSSYQRDGQSNNERSGAYRESEVNRNEQYGSGDSYNNNNQPDYNSERNRNDQSYTSGATRSDALSGRNDNTGYGSGRGERQESGLAGTQYGRDDNNSYNSPAQDNFRSSGVTDSERNGDSTYGSNDQTGGARNDEYNSDNTSRTMGGISGSDRRDDASFGNRDNSSVTRGDNYNSSSTANYSNSDSLTGNQRGESSTFDGNSASGRNDPFDTTLPHKDNTSSYGRDSTSDNLSTGLHSGRESSGNDYSNSGRNVSQTGISDTSARRDLDSHSTGKDYGDNVDRTSGQYSNTTSQAGYGASTTSSGLGDRNNSNFSDDPNTDTGYGASGLTQNERKDHSNLSDANEKSKPSMMDKIKGTMETVQGKMKKDESLVQHGQQLKTGNAGNDFH